MKSDNKSRRSFLGAGAAGLAGGTGLLAQVRTAVPRTRPKVELLQVGAVALGDVSHMPAIWGPLINPDNDGQRQWPTRTSQMTLSHCWDSKPEVTQQFAKSFRCEGVKNYYDMVDKVDAMIFGGLLECKWWPELVKPYLEAGIPCFINRPFAVSMKDAHEMIELSKKHNAPIMSMSGHETMETGIAAKQKVASLLKDGQKIFGTHATTGAHEYTWHAVHAMYLQLSVLGTGVDKVSVQAPGWWPTKTTTNPAPMDWGNITLHYPGLDLPGAGRQDNPLLGMVQTIPGNYGSRATFRMFHTGGWADFDHQTVGGFVDNFYHLQARTVFDMAVMFETRKMPQSYEYIEAKTKIVLAGFKSLVDHNGMMVNVNDLPEDWEAPSAFPDWIDESIFR